VERIANCGWRDSQRTVHSRCDSVPTSWLQGPARTNTATGEHETPPPLAGSKDHFLRFRHSALGTRQAPPLFSPNTRGLRSSLNDVASYRAASTVDRSDEEAA